jgi:hypothetical protein
MEPSSSHSPRRGLVRERGDYAEQPGSPSLILSTRHGLIKRKTGSTAFSVFVSAAVLDPHPLALLRRHGEELELARFDRRFPEGAVLMSPSGGSSVRSA